MAAAGRICSGVVQVGEKLRVLPGDETAIVRCLFIFVSQGRCFLTSLFSSFQPLIRNRQMLHGLRQGPM
jgi:hypothetical protein